MRLPARPPMRLFVAVTVVVVVLLAVLIVAVNVPARPVLAPISAIDYTQSKAVEGFSDFSHRTTDPGRIAVFTALVEKYSIDLTHFDRSLNDVCTGGLATDITLDRADLSTVKLRVYDCGRTVPRGTFVSDTSALFTRWRASDGG